MVGPIIEIETGYERMFNTLKVSNTTNDSSVIPELALSSCVYRTAIFVKHH